MKSVAELNIDFEKLWNPKVFIQNAIGNHNIKICRHVEYNNHGEAFLVETRQGSGTYTEHLQLYQFPFDMQVNYGFKYFDSLLVSFNIKKHC